MKEEASFISICLQKRDPMVKTKFKKPKDYWTCFAFTINPQVSYYKPRDEFFRCSQGNQPGEEYLIQMQRLTDLTDYPDDTITVDQFLFHKMVTGLNDAHHRQKLYKEGKDLTMEKASHMIRIYAAMHKSQGMIVNYFKYKEKAQPNNKNNT